MSRWRVNAAIVSMFGLVNINKPVGLSSRDVVNRVQRLVRPGKAGHAGTLDPIASGVLVVCVGPATRLIEYVQRMPKRYLGTFLLGRQSVSEDIESELEELTDAPVPTSAEIEAILPQFTGVIEQVPPKFSALKVQGKRAYELARRGEQVELAPRKIEIHELTLVAYDYPRVVFDVLCGSGTYIRSLGRDLAHTLNTAAVMSALERTAIGDFRVEDALELTTMDERALQEHLRPAIEAVAELPRVQLSQEEQQQLHNGVFIHNRFGVAAAEVAGCDGRGELTCLLTPRGDQLRPLRNFVTR